MLHKSTVAQPTLVLLNELMNMEALSSFVLVGGTALSLQIGHRISFDLDLFTPSNFDENQLLSVLIEKYPKTIVTLKDKNTLNLVINSIKVDFMRHNFPNLSTVIEEESIRLISMEDIAAMKVNAICNRGCKKDFYDIYFLLKLFSMQEIFQFFAEKYKNTDVFFAQKSLLYFEDANAEPNPNTIEALSWGEVKKEIENQLRK
ncbi:MAG: nucleotidyl transferase AbiEii/AbiGii toxin family protein [Flavobacteriales bacterium]|nr:nucleotidyl transferase AbiEii/AbiGii toxin family protein [Flavobacteriales bacterium]